MAQHDTICSLGCLLLFIQNHRVIVFIMTKFKLQFQTISILLKVLWVTFSKINFLGSLTYLYFA